MALLIARLADYAASRTRLARVAPTHDTSLPPAFAIGVKQPVTWSIDTHGQRRTAGAARSTITPTPACARTACRLALTWPAERAPRPTYSVTPTARGEVAFAPADVRVRSRWGSGNCSSGSASRSAPRLSGLRAGRALCLAGRRSPAAGDWHQDLPPARRGDRLQAAVGVSRRRSRASHRLAGDAAPRQADRPRVPGRARSVRDAADRLRPPHARRRSRGAAGRRTSIRC